MAGRRTVLSSEVHDITSVHELEELRGADDRVRHGTGLEDVLLQHLGAVVHQVRHQVGADNREDHRVADADGLGGRQQVVHRRLEERGRGLIEGRRVRQVDDDIGSRQRLVQTLPAQQVKSGGRRVWHRLVPARLQDLHHLRS